MVALYNVCFSGSNSQTVQQRGLLEKNSFEENRQLNIFYLYEISLECTAAEI